jgi:predicted MPP superfamily phosphohydrolase
MNWLACCLFVVICVGHAALCIGVKNRSVNFRLSLGVVHTFALLAFLSILLVPAAFLGLFGIGENSPFVTGSWNRLPLPVQTYGMVCVAVAASIPVIALRRHWRSPPRVLKSEQSRMLNLAGDDPRPLTETTIGRLCSRLPGNQVLHLSISDKTLELPRLPAEWDGLTIAHVSDTHFCRHVGVRYFERVAEQVAALDADLIAVTGDLLDLPECLDWFDRTLGRLRAPLGCWFVLGNHDWYSGVADEIRTRMTRLGWRDAAANVSLLLHREHRLLIAGSERPWLSPWPNLRTPDCDHADFRLVLSHSPDDLPLARRDGVDLLLAGHLHGGQIRLPFWGPVLSPSRSGGRYASGTFHEPPTALHVSRGLGGREPLRWNCPPDLTRLILRPVATTAARPKRPAAAVLQAVTE